MPRVLTAAVAGVVALLLALPAAALPLPAVETTFLLVRVESGADAAAVHAAVGTTVVNRIPAIEVDVVEVARTRVRAVLRAYRGHDDVAFAERNRIVRAAATPDDDYVADQYALRQIRARKGWGEYGHLWRRTGGAPIAVIDSGIDLLHPEFAGKISHCRSFLTGTGRATPTCQDSQLHGTHVAGIAAAAANDGGIAGVAFDSPIMALQVINSTGFGFTADVAAAMVYAARNGAKVANYSLSAPTSSRTERAAIAYARSRKVTQVGAAGNTGRRGVEYPARYKRVIAVAATDRSGGRAAFSTFGPQVEVAAPGAAILSTYPGGGVVYGTLDGTSMAAPHVSGLAALLRSRGYGLKRTRRLIRRAAVDLGPAGRDERYGFGRINVARSLP